ncbi:MAG: hypothetical protein ACOZB3_03295 [Calditrichota bacterium]
MSIVHNRKNILNCDNWPILLISLVVTRILSIYSFYLYDDAFISFRYAANLANGLGLIYNPGEYVQGITAPLWGLLLALTYKTGIPMEWAALGWGILFELAAVGIVVRYLTEELRARAGWFVAVLVALDPYLAKQAVGGMESSLLLAVTVVAIGLAVRRRFMAAAVSSAISGFIRPEGLILCVVLIVVVWLRERRFPLRPFLTGFVILAAGVAIQYGYYGELIPASVRGKMVLAGSWESLWILALFPVRDPLQCVLTITAFIGLPWAWRESRFIRIYTLWSLTLFLIWIVTGTHLWPWYCVPFWFWKILITAILFEVILQKLPQLEKRSKKIPIVTAPLIVAVWITFILAYGPDRMTANIYHRIRDFAKEHDFSGQTAYGMDFGAFGYYTGLTIRDEPGLVWPAGRETYRSDMKDILLHEQPDWAWVTVCCDNARVMHTAPLDTLYKPLWRASYFGDTTLALSLHTGLLWTPDFVLYQRTLP